MADAHYDVVVIGAGVGGLFAAACLVNAGKSVLLIDDHDRVGGRATSYNVDGFTVNMGAIALEKGGVFERLLNETGVELDVREPDPATVFRVDGKIVNAAKGGLGFLLGGLTKSAAKIGAKFAAAREGDLPEEKLTTKEWLAGFTKNKTVHALFRNFCAALFAANANELPARAFLTYFGVKGAFKRFGFCSRGTIGVWNDLADGIRRRGGEVRLETKAKRIIVEDGVAVGVIIETGDVETTISTRIVISNAGAMATIALAGEAALGADYVARAKRTIRPTTIFNYYLALPKRVVEIPGLITFANTERLCTLGELTATCPETAPEGWHLYVAYSVPLDSMGPVDKQAEIDFAMEELRAEYPAFAEARLLVATPMAGDWPAQRTCAGWDMEQETPVANLWNVGDSVKPYGDGGTQACADTGRTAAEQAITYLSR
ncbi:predicted amine oxidase [Sphingobium indicum BiD32]|uniref:Predicted amine oxidase n=1 Tax=Sphingobium indicum BiD32 TaxID=1301087 RepID=N1MPR2_9SPHN|nr:FAD-dependent oxidoreductase [Sphingobium indicum]CCW18699.1 predicted amine oxidase [Sphingobium indicum BiD32]